MAAARPLAELADHGPRGLQAAGRGRRRALGRLERLEDVGDDGAGDLVQPGDLDRQPLDLVVAQRRQELGGRLDAERDDEDGRALDAGEGVGEGVRHRGGAEGVRGRGMEGTRG